MNFIFDFVLLLATSMILKRKEKIYKIFLGSLFGSLSIFFMFLKINSVELFFLKFLISLLMIFISFGYKSMKYLIKNIYYLYTVSIILGGFLYFINITFSYKNEGLIFINKGISINFIVALILSPIIIYLYVKQVKDLKNNYNNYYNIGINLDNKNISLTAFLDTGNKLIDPYKKYPIILVDKKFIDITNKKVLYVPYHTVNSNGILKCIKADKININGVSHNRKYLIALSDEIKIDGVNCILNERLLEG